MAKTMAYIDNDLAQEGFERTEMDSPYDEDGTLWQKNSEVVCDETAIVVEDTEEQFDTQQSVAELSERTVRYNNSSNVKLPGGFIDAYPYDYDEGRYRY